MIIENLCFSYGEKKIFENFSARFNDGITCIMGPSGRGKTTLLYLIAGLLVPDSGIISGAPKMPAVMFQDDRLLMWHTALKNVELAASKEDRGKAQTLLEKLDIPPEMYPGKLSGGMSRRVALARALVIDSDMLILDEPFTGMDYDLSKKCASMITETGKPAVITTHSPEEAKLLGAEIITL